MPTLKEQILSARKQQKQGLNQWIENFNQQTIIKTTKLHILIYIIAMWLDFSISNRNSEISLSNTSTCLRPKKSIKANFPR